MIWKKYEKRYTFSGHSRLNKWVKSWGKRNPTLPASTLWDGGRLGLALELWVPLATWLLCACAVTSASDPGTVAQLQAFWAERLQTASLSCWDIVGEAAGCSRVHCGLGSGDWKAWGVLRRFQSPRNVFHFGSQMRVLSLDSLNSWQSHGIGRMPETGDNYHIREKDLRKIHKAACTGNRPQVQKAFSSSIQRAWMTETGWSVFPANLAWMVNGLHQRIKPSMLMPRKKQQSRQLERKKKKLKCRH